MDDDKIVWKETKPDYTLVNAKYLKERKSKFVAGSLEKVVEDLVKTWEMESSHKIREEVSIVYMYKILIHQAHNVDVSTLKRRCFYVVCLLD